MIALSLLCVGLDEAPASAATTPSSGFSITETGPVGTVLPGGLLRYQFQLVNGDTVTSSPLVATDTIPAGTSLVPHSQSCGTGGGTCSESSLGSTLEWEIPAGTAPTAFFVFSFTVIVTTHNPPSEIPTRLIFSGPGCWSATSCIFDSLPIPVNAGGGESVPVSARAIRAPYDGGGSTTTGNVGQDNQSIVVQVPKCVAHQQKTTCAQKGKGHGPQTSALSGASGVKPVPTHLAYTGDDQILSVEAGLLSVFSGTCLLLGSVLSRRRKGGLLA